MLFLTRTVKQNRVQIPSLAILGLLVSASVAIAAPSKLQPVVSTPETDKPKVVRVKRDNIRVQLTQCLKDAEKVTCTFLLSSLKNNEITLWVTDPARQKSRVIDGEGNEYNSFEILQFGAENQGVPVVRRVPIKLVLSFTKLPEKLANASLVEIGLETYGHEIPIQFRQVTFLSAAAQSTSPTKPGSGPKRPSGDQKPSDTPPEETEEEQPDETPASEEPQNTPEETKTSPSPAPVQRVPKSPSSKPQGTPPTAKPAQPDQAQPDETQTDESQPDDSQTEQSQPDDAQPEEAQPEEVQPEDSQTEQSQPDDAQTEDAQPEEAQPEDSQTEQSQPEDAQTEESQPEDSQTPEDSPPAPAKPAAPPKAPAKP
ncbi:MAG TPA: hypothetical protein V6D19_03190 [Stenomitos sp.]